MSKLGQFKILWLQIAGLPSGVYQMSVETGTDKIMQSRFVKK
jgi:hypothetical protein